MNGTDSLSRPARARAKRSARQRRTIWLSLATIALIGGIASYLRTLGVIQAVDGHAIMNWFEAGLADPTIAAASVNIVDAHRRTGKIPKLSLLSIGVAAVVTLGANVRYGHPQPVPEWLVNVWPPVAFLLAFESLMSYLRRADTDDPADADDTDDRCPHGVALTLDDAVRNAYAHGRDCEGAAPRFVDLAAAFDMERRKVAALVRPTTPEPQPELAKMNGSAP